MDERRSSLVCCNETELELLAHGWTDGTRFLSSKFVVSFCIAARQSMCSKWYETFHEMSQMAPTICANGHLTIHISTQNLPRPFSRYSSAIDTLLAALQLHSNQYRLDGHTKKVDEATTTTLDSRKFALFSSQCYHRPLTVGWIINSCQQQWHYEIRFNTHAFAQWVRHLFGRDWDLTFTVLRWYKCQMNWSVPICWCRRELKFASIRLNTEPLTSSFCLFYLFVWVRRIYLKRWKEHLQSKWQRPRE